MKSNPAKESKSPKPAAETATLSSEERARITEHYPLIERVVYGMRSQLAAHADLEELRSVGLTGLINAVRNFDQAREDSFRGYAVLRIRGAILDELRRMDWMSRTSRRKHRELQDAVERLEQELGRAPRNEEIRRHLELSTRDFHRLQRQTQKMTFVSLDFETGMEQESSGVTLHEQIADDSQKLGYEDLEQEELLESMVEELEQLPERQRKVLAFYYHEKLKLSEIAKVFGVTEARICQIHGQAIQSLKVAMARRESVGAV